MKKLVCLAAIAAFVVGCDSSSSGTDSGTPGTDSGATDSGSGDSGMMATPTCAAYCTTIMAGCTATNAQYGTMEACMGSCAGFPVGTAADTMGNTLGCRSYHATVAAMAGMADTHCPHAGPLGAAAGMATCGMNCEGFCAVALAACTGANEQYADAAECMTECAGFMNTTAYNATVTSGDSLACRMYHLSVASTGGMNATTHCPHIVEASPPCM